MFRDILPETLPESVSEAGAVIRCRRDKTEFPEEGVSPSLDTVKVVREELCWIHFRVFLLES